MIEEKISRYLNPRFLKHLWTVHEARIFFNIAEVDAMGRSQDEARRERVFSIRKTQSASATDQFCELVLKV